MKVFVTGGNGFVGLNIVSALVQAGHEVFCLVRKNSNMGYLEQFDVTKVIGSLEDNHFLNEITSQVDAVIHTAGVTGCKRSELEKLIAVNADCTRRLSDAALANGVTRFVYTSTTSTVGCSNGQRRADESVPLTGFRARNPYGISKQMAENILLEAADKGLDTIILNPAEVVGPFDYNLQWGRIVLAVAFNQLPFVPPGGGSFCHAGEVGRAHVNALTMGRAGEKYILAGEDVSFKQYIETIESLLGKVSDRPGGNYWLKYFKAWASENFPYLINTKPAVEAYRMRVFGGHYYFDSSKAVNELDYREASLEDMLSACIQWYQSTGMVPAKAA
ncbi:NAD-dependent epimerase/dehydratase family protein [Teredinibacter turnerae]|uniref:NAD-dependent epimerase/dehydratase family protein n=1 Tax=Teredinibacter turnerae TaxID=2426 RepID=UPI0030D0B035